MTLFPKDLDREAGTVRIWRGKGGKQRTVGIDPAAFALVELGLCCEIRVNCLAVGPTMTIEMDGGMLPGVVYEPGIAPTRDMLEAAGERSRR